MYIYVWMYICVYVCMYVGMYVCLYMYICVCIYVYLNVVNFLMFQVDFMKIRVVRAGARESGATPAKPQR